MIFMISQFEETVMIFYWTLDDYVGWFSMMSFCATDIPESIMSGVQEAIGPFMSSPNNFNHGLGTHKR